MYFEPASLVYFTRILFDHETRPFVLLAPVCTLFFLLLGIVVAEFVPSILARKNFAGKRVGVIGGMAITIGIGWAAWKYLSDYLAVHSDPGGEQGPTLSFLVAVVGFGVLGLIDDLFGDRTARGFRGHVSALFRDHRVTTGLIKVVGGLLISWVAATVIMGPDVNPESILDCFTDPRSWFSLDGTWVIPRALLIASFANSINLLDTRPGRSLAAGIILSLVAVVLLVFGGHWGFGGCVVMLLTSAIVVYPFDSLGKIMLGDAGSNATGAGLGVCAITLLNGVGVLILLMLLLAFQLWCEKHSLTAFIESKPLLRAIDRKIGVRE